MKDFNNQTFCFLGRSGSGKDTQANLLRNYLEQRGFKILWVSTGDQGRLLQQKKTKFGVWVNEILTRGDIFPHWLATYLWLKIFEDQLVDNETVFFPSSPRTVDEARAIDEFMSALKRPLPVPVYLEISDDEACSRLIRRGRTDDNLPAIKERFSWFRARVLPIIDYYENRVIKIEGFGDPKKDVFPRLLEKLKG